ncbi:WecB/TagA/CpsF family glycosyltransferase [Nocardioides mangrovicus]|uniref:WecB/TagA/CpsF family glycosyltransferase n=1 Tax=Nocardioides mangrovicus TaxID=2478913 RepID=A0A3L8P2B3_9ACTN|nr:WecB/TagA/CpsF family glycosyltransferase [Nocardioides mangrovicus]RLV49294.1 WecB/TagA/CpsF family glycosyltransferase [Nocardioides mangrovicus]
MTVAEDFAPTQASVVIPAHNEAEVLPRCLEALYRQPGIGACDVVVVANGCTDATAEVARRFRDRLPQLQVVELGAAGKVGALNAGDAVATGFPRIYLDADVELGEEALPGLIDSLAADDARVATPQVTFDVRGSSRVVRSFYRVFSELPYARRGLIGLGVYGVSRSGRARFGAFPDVIADDLFVQRCFDDHERHTSPGDFTVYAPRTVSDLVRVRSRVSRGNAQIAEHDDLGAERVDTAHSTGESVGALRRRLLRRPHDAGAVLVYVAVTMLARMVGRWGDHGTWARDESSRRPLHEVQDDSSSQSDAAREPGAVDSVRIDGVPVATLSEDEIVAHVFAALDRGDGGLIMTPNVDHMRQLSSMPERDQIIDDCELVVPDGMPLIWASRIQGTPLPERVAGSDLVWSLAGEAAVRGRSVFLLGGAPGVAERAGEAFERLCPGMRLAGVSAPPPGFERDEWQMRRLTTDLRRAQPDLVFVALGFPRQEQLAAELAPVLPGAWFLGCGGALDMASGDRQRAAGWVQCIGGEWVHRLVLEPRRLARRYLVDDAPYAIGMLSRAAVRRVRRRG